MYQILATLETLADEEASKTIERSGEEVTEGEGFLIGDAPKLIKLAKLNSIPLLFLGVLT